MKAIVFSLLIMLPLLIPAFATISEGQNMDPNQALSAKQRSIIPIAAFTANGDMEKLKSALNDGLDAGLTVNEIKEILVQMYAIELNRACRTLFVRTLSGFPTP